MEGIDGKHAYPMRGERHMTKSHRTLDNGGVRYPMGGVVGYLKGGVVGYLKGGVIRYLPPSGIYGQPPRPYMGNPLGGLGPPRRVCCGGG